MRAGDIINGQGKVLRNTTVARGEERAPEIPVTKSTRSNELENIYFDGYVALPTELLD